MAMITNPQLEIGGVSSAGIVNASVSCVLRFTNYELAEMKQGLTFALHCALWEDDPIADDFVFSFTSKLYPDTTPMVVEDVKFLAPIASHLLDKDVGRDEIYGKLRLVNTYTGKKVQAKTNTVKRRF